MLLITDYMVTFDFIFAFILFWGAFSGYRNGFLVEIFLCIGIGIATVVSLHSQTLVSNYMKEFPILNNESYQVLVCCCVFFVIFLFILLLASILRRFLHYFFLRYIDQLLGVFLGILRWILIIAGKIFFLQTFFSTIVENYVQHAFCFPFIQKIILYIKQIIHLLLQYLQ